MKSFRPILVRFAALSFLFNHCLHAEPTPAPSVESTLEEKRTATELPTKRKLPTNKTVSVQPRETDVQIRDRLTRIALSQDVFRKVKVEVVEGIVSLKGEVEEEAYAKSFSALAEKVSGVIGVVDQLQVTNAQKTGLRQAQSEVRSLTQRFFKFLPYLASCFIILMITLALGYGVYFIARRIFSRRMQSRPILARNFAKLTALPIYLLGIYLVLQVGGMNGLAATLVGGTGVLGIILGLAAKNIIENALSSFMLTLRNPFQIGDHVLIGAEEGVVEDMDSRCTTIINADGVPVQIPNSTVLTAIIKNISSRTRAPRELSDMRDRRERAPPTPRA